MPRHTLCP